MCSIHPKNSAYIHGDILNCIQQNISSHVLVHRNECFKVSSSLWSCYILFRSITFKSQSIRSSLLHVSAVPGHRQATVYLAKTGILYFPLYLKLISYNLSHSIRRHPFFYHCVYSLPRKRVYLAVTYQ
jgi:hypothetical protein